MSVLVFTVLALIIVYIIVYRSVKAKDEANTQINQNNSNTKNTNVSNHSLPTPDISDIEPYLMYLKTGAFEKNTVEKDIELCENIINPIDNMLKTIYGDNVKEIYIEQANTYKSFISSSIDAYSNQDLAITVIDACDKVIANPSYENCVYLDDVYMLLNPKFCDIKHTDNSKQEMAHVRLYNRLDAVKRMINLKQA